MEPKQLNINNYNNVFACDVFGYIAKAPAIESLPSNEEIEQMVFSIHHEGSVFFVKIKEIALYKFNLMPDHITLLCNGMMADDWRAWWAAKKPGYDNPRMAVYFYEKIKK